MFGWLSGVRLVHAFQLLLGRGWLPYLLQDVHFVRWRTGVVVVWLVCRSGNKFHVKFQSVTVKVVVLQCISSGREIYGSVTDLHFNLYTFGDAAWLVVW